MNRKSGSEPDIGIRLQVEKLHSRYAHALDADRLEDWPGLFTEEGIYRIATFAPYSNLPGGGITFTQFLSEDVVRHPLVQRIVHAYEPHGSRREG